MSYPHGLPTMRTDFTKKFAATLPLMQGPMLGAVSVEMVAAAAESGALGCYPLGYGPRTDADFLEPVENIRLFTSLPFGVNVMLYDPDGDSDIMQSKESLKPALLSGSRLPLIRNLLSPIRRNLGISEIDESDEPDGPETPHKTDLQRLVRLAVAAKVHFVSFTFGIPPNWVLKQLHAGGVRTIGTATSVGEALLVERAGMSGVILSGVESGGATPAFSSGADQQMGLFGLLCAVRGRVSIPIIAAGGVSDAQCVKACLDLGASAAVLGTALLLSYESVWPEKQRVAEHLACCAKSGELPCSTVVSRVYTGKRTRLLQTPLTERLVEQDGSVPYWPLQRSVMADFRMFFASQPSHPDAPVPCGVSYSAAQTRSVRDIVFTIAEGLAGGGVAKGGVPVAAGPGGARVESVFQAGRMQGGAAADRTEAAC